MVEVRDGFPKTEIVRIGFGGRWAEWRGGEVTQKIFGDWKGYFELVTWEVL